MQISIEDRARFVMSLAHGGSRLDDVRMRAGVDSIIVEAWVAELLHAAPERFDPTMMRRLVAQGLVADDPRTQQFGRLEDVGALDLLQSLSIYRRPGHVLFFHPHGISVLWFEAGEIVDARSGGLRGAEAVYRIVGHDRGDFLVEVTGRVHPRTIELPTSALVFEAARRLDETHRLDPRMPDPSTELRCSIGAPTSGLGDAFGEGATLGEALERSEMGELETRQRVAEAFAAGWLEPTGRTRAGVIPNAQVRAAAMRSVALEISQPLVTSAMAEAAEAMQLEPIEAVPRRRRALALVGGFVLAAAGVVLALSVSMTAEREEPRAEAELAPRVVVAETVVEEVDVVAVGTPRSGPSIRTDEIVIEEGPPTSRRSSTKDEAASDQPRSRTKTPRAQEQLPPDEPHEDQTAEDPSPQLAADDPATLLVRARAAYAAGQGATAHRLATRSHEMRPGTDAAELAVLAACLMKKPGRAHEALRNVPLLRRPGIRNKCKREHGLRPKRAR